MTRALVAHGSKRGGTSGLAEMIAAALRQQGMTVDVQHARAVRDIAGYDAVVLGGVLYTNRWHRDARRFARRHQAALREMPVWLFSSGPLDDSAAEGDIPPVPQVQQVAKEIRARGHATFGGRLTPDAKGFIARKMAKTRSGDWRDRDQVTAWVQEITSALGR